jgi:hypothetical protein
MIALASSLNTLPAACGLWHHPSRKERKKERKQQPTSRVASHGRHDAVQDGRPRSYLRGTDGADAPRRSALMFGFPDR